MFGANRSVSCYLALTVSIAMGAIFALTWFAAALENSAAEKRQAQVARFVTDDIFANLSDKLSLMSFWQDAYDNTVVRWNAKWVDYQFGTYQDSVPVDATLIADRFGTIRHLYQKPLPVRLDGRTLEASRELLRLIQVVEAMPRVRRPMFAHGIVVIGAAPFFAAASRILPERDMPGLRDPRNDIIAVYLKRADATSYRALTRTFGITGIGISTRGGRDRPSIPLLDAAGVETAHLWWKPQRSGDEYLAIVLPIGFLVLLALVFVQGRVVRRWQAMVSELYRAESKADAAEADSRAKTSFLGVLSHELRTPLNAILGFSEIAQSQMFGPLGSPKYVEHAGHIYSGARRLLHIVDDLLEIAEIETNGVEPRAAPSELNAAIRHNIERVRNAAAQKQVSIAFAPCEPAGLLRFGGPELDSIFVHLLENAIKFSRAGGAVDVRAETRAGQAVICIKDTGIGIEGCNIDRLGNPFVQVEGHLTRKHGGLGVGLAIARRLVGAMGGSLDIESTPDEGTLVTVALPLCDPREIVERQSADAA